MPSDYKRICEDNIRRRGTEFDDIGRLISEQLYSDRSHFIYELLQNAQDALERRFKQNTYNRFPSKVQFRLYQDRLEFRHFGVLFNEEDVKGISDVLKGTKKDELTQIGKFGIGFKSVYAFTSSPEVHSGEEHFVIKRYIRPEEKRPHMEISEGETVFNFPFDHEELRPEEAFKLILEKLETLGPRVLLFLRHIDEIEWFDDTGNHKGQYLKEAKRVKNYNQARRVTVIGQKNGQEEEENWLIFEKPLNAEEAVNQLYVEAGFRIKKDQKDGKEQIVRTQNAPLVAFFPTEIYTGLGFLIQGPYRTTPARDNIAKDDAWNKKLIEETATLITESLQCLKEMGFMSVSLLWTLPIRMEEFSVDSMFFPIAMRVSNALKERDLLPAFDGTFVAGKKAKLGRGEDLRRLLGPKQLQDVFNNQTGIKWLSGEITEVRTPELRRYLIEHLEVEEIRPENMAEKLSESFLSRQSDDWIIALYGFFLNKEDLWKRPNTLLRKQKIIRMQNNQHVKPFKEDGTPCAYLPSTVKTEFPAVKASIYKDENAAEFLKKLGIMEPDLFGEIIEFILPKYTENPLLTFEENIEDLKKINQLSRVLYSTKQEKAKTPERKAKLRILLTRIGMAQDENYFSDPNPIAFLMVVILPEVPILRAVKEKKRNYKLPRDIYYNGNVLRQYFHNNPEVWFLSDEYDAYSEDFKDLFSLLQIKSSPKVHKSKPSDNGFVIISENRGDHRRGLNSFDPTIEVDGLEHALNNPTIEKSQFIWNNIALEYSACIRGMVETATRQTYENSKIEEQVSDFGHLLRESQWLPDKNGNMYLPRELQLDQLPESFIRDEFLAKQLGMQKNVVAALAEEAGIDVEVIEFCRQHPEEFRKWKAGFEKKHSKPTFPNESSKDPERRQEKLDEQIQKSPGKTYETRERSVRVTSGTIDAKEWLRNKYTNDAGQMICQICKNVMPFRKKNGEYYFEAVEAFSKDHFTKEHEAQFLALCPVCAAKYNEFVKKDEQMMADFKDVLVHSENPEISLPLGKDETSVRFVESHHLDIKTIIEGNY